MTTVADLPEFEGADPKKVQYFELFLEFHEALDVYVEVMSRPIEERWVYHGCEHKPDGNLPIYWLFSAFNFRKHSYGLDWDGLHQQWFKMVKKL